MINIVNETSLQLAWIAGKKEFPQDSLSIVVKGSYQLIEDGIAEESAALPVTGDVFDEDDISKELTYDSDFAHFKPVADLLLKGSCYTPEARPLVSCEVRFAVAGVEKTLHVHGARYVSPSLIGNTTSPPQPFTSMPLTFQNAYGGTGYAKNPLGKGRDKDSDGLIWLPTITDPDAGQKEPASFGPINRSWPQRAAKLGSYDGDYMDNRWPWFPEDFDWAYYNAATEDMQFDGYLNGDEKLVMENLHPELAHYRSQLPGVRPRCFLHEPEGDESFREVEMNLDTLWVDMDTQQLVLVWRGVSDTKSPDFTEFTHVYLAQEELSGESLSKDDHFENFQALIVPVAAVSAEAEKDESEQAPAKPEEPAPAQENKSEKAMQEALQQSRDVMQQAGHDPAIIDQIMSSADPAPILASFLASLGMTQEQADAHISETQENMKASLREQGMGDDEIAVLFDED